jgi:hypothetical protein
MVDDIEPFNSFDLDMNKVQPGITIGGSFLNKINSPGSKDP